MFSVYFLAPIKKFNFHILNLYKNTNKKITKMIERDKMQKKLLTQSIYNFLLRVNNKIYEKYADMQDTIL